MFTGVCELGHADPIKDVITSMVITRPGFLAMYEEHALEKFTLKDSKTHKFNSCNT